ncbi:uridine kinase [Aquimarina agarilytica]|uniref:uridine kinase n=1 Tax=Aquimarina agarilytica TaxID=1087449 RepID=UPI00028A0828|nr:uridine kinase [Aquimarina agarilytica]
MYIIGITGGTASGKTTFVTKLLAQCDPHRITMISQDDYYKPLTGLSLQEKNNINFDHPNSIDFDLLEKHILSLKKGELINKPNYSFETHDRLEKVTTISPKPILILEGILVLSVPKIKALCNYTIFVDASEKTRQERRLKRDIAERGRDKETILEQFKTNIHPMHRKFIEPLKNEVNLVIDGTKNFNEPINSLVNLIETKIE